MRAIEVSALNLFNAGRWRVEIFTDDNSENIVSKWPSVRIAEIAEESSVAVGPQDYGVNEFYYVGLENVEPVTGDSVDLRKRGKNEIKSRSKVFGKDYVLYGRLRPYLRKVFLAEGACSEGLCSTEFIVLKPIKDKVLPQVLRALLASETISKQLARFEIGAALPRVSPGDFFRATVPLPTMEIQEEMAAKLSALKTERLHYKARLAESVTGIDRIVADLALLDAKIRGRRLRQRS